MKVSVITPTYNSEKTIQRTLNSIGSQSYRDFEHIVIDGASKDNTIRIIRDCSSHAIRLYSEADKGIYDAMNKGVSNAFGDIIAILNSDDFYSDHYVLHDVVALFKAGADIVYGGIRFCDAGGHLRSQWIPDCYAPGAIAKGWHSPHPAFFARASLYAKKGGFSLKYRVASDFDLMLRFLSDNSVKCSRLPRVLVIMQDDGNSSKPTNIFRGAHEIYQSLNENNVNFNFLYYFSRRYLSKLRRRFFLGH